MQAGHCSQVSSRLSSAAGAPAMPRGAGAAQAGRLKLAHSCADSSRQVSRPHSLQILKNSKAAATSAQAQCSQQHLSYDVTDDTEDEYPQLHKSFPGVCCTCTHSAMVHLRLHAG